MNTLNKLIDWFLYSPIYNKDGAYLAYYSFKEKGPAYPEITAYAISLSCILYKRRKDEEFLERAERCAEYLIKINKNGAIPCFSDNFLYAFDTGIFISSMFDLYALTHNKVYLNEAKKSVNWLYSLWNGRLFSAVDNVPENKDWYHVPSVHLVKLIIPLIKASTYLKDQKHEITALKLLGEYGQRQKEDGSFKISEGSDMIMTHPHCYATEAFLYAYHAFKREEFHEIAKKSSDWLCKVQNQDGSFYRYYNLEKIIEGKQNREKLKTSDATAQATRIWKLLGVNKKGIEKAYKYLNTELKDNGLRLLKSTSFKEKLFSWRRPVYSWPTFFYLHSLLLTFGSIDQCKELF